MARCTIVAIDIDVRFMQRSGVLVTTAADVRNARVEFS